MTSKLILTLAVLTTSIAGWGFFGIADPALTSTTITLPSDQLKNSSLIKVPSSSGGSSKKVNKLTIPSNKVIYVNGVIGYQMESLIQELKEKEKTPGDIYLLINSPGGSVVAGALFISAMEASKVHVNTVCMELCASMAYMILEHGNKRYGVDRAILMGHPATAGAQGTLEQMAARTNFLIRYTDKLSLHISRKLGMSLEDYKSLVVSEHWIDSEDALEKRLLDGIVDINTEARPQPLGFNLPSTERTGPSITFPAPATSSEFLISW